MYQILCDGYVLYDPRDDELIVKNKKCKIGSNICGEASFSILANHPHYEKLQKLKSVFEIKQDNDTIFRGRMTDESRDFDNIKVVDLEGAMAYLNDSVIRPFTFPDDFPDAKSAKNIVEYFFAWIIEQHNSQVQDFQKFKVGKVTVTDPNNYLSRSNTDYANSWTTVKDKLFGSSLGGYLCIRYEADGNYLDYLADYADDSGNKLVNSQAIEYGKNLLDFKNESDGSETYSAIIPLGKGESSEKLTLSSLADGDITDDIVKKGDTLYSKKAVEAFGWICAPTSDTTFEDVTDVKNLCDRGVSFLKSKSAGFLETTTMTAIDLHLTDAEIESFRVYKYVAASSSPHGASGVYPLSELDLDLDNLQNTKITVGETKSGLTDKTADIAQKVTQAAKKEDIKTSIEENNKSIKIEVAKEISGLELAIAEIELQYDSILLAVEDFETALSQTLRVAADGVTITNQEGSVFLIDGGNIKADSTITAPIIKGGKFFDDEKNVWLELGAQSGNYGFVLGKGDGTGINRIFSVYDAETTNVSFNAKGFSFLRTDADTETIYPYGTLNLTGVNIVQPYFLINEITSSTFTIGIFNIKAGDEVVIFARPLNSTNTVQHTIVADEADISDISAKFNNMPANTDVEVGVSVNDNYIGFRVVRTTKS